jgi:hypothetical protein
MPKRKPTENEAQKNIVVKTIANAERGLIPYQKITCDGINILLQNKVLWLKS